jgi:TPR repeat protein
MARLVIENHQTFANEPLPLGISLNDAAGGEVVRLNGLARGTRLSPGSPLGAAGWLLSAVEIGKAMAYAPKDFVGAMDAAIELRSSSNELVDSQLVRLEWIAKPSEAWQARQEPKNAPVMQSLDSGEIASMLKRGNDLLKIGNVASARLVLHRAANAGNAQAAMTLGMTYDPRVLAELGVLGSVPDASQARAWYQKAADLGSIEAQRRIDQLARVYRRP